mmetsp:Transcript_5092/g.4645  ORF Transcript_5092/g.4645 Transcript_5092/m.4645 type:complete len:171 (+) Transcript_5092:222-734(+)
MIQRVLAKNKQEEERRRASNSKNFFKYKYHEMLDLKKKLNKVFKKNKKPKAEGESSRDSNEEDSQGEKKNEGSFQEVESDDDHEFELTLKLKKEEREAQRLKNTKKDGKKINKEKEKSPELSMPFPSVVKALNFEEKKKSLLNPAGEGTTFLTTIQEHDAKHKSKMRMSS